MKKIFYFIASAIVALGAVACQNDIEEGIDAGQQTEGFSIKVTIDEQTRVSLGDPEEGKGRKLTFTEGDVLVVRSGWDEGTNYLFEYTQGEGEVYTFTCTDEGVSALVGTNPNVFYLGGLHEQANDLIGFGYICNTAAESIEGIGMYANNTMQDSTFGAEDYVINMGAMPLLKFTASEAVTFTSDSPIFFANGGWANEYTTNNTGEIYLPIITSSGNDCKVTVTTGSGFNKSFKTKLEENTIYNLGTIALAPVELKGSWDNWADPVKMYVKNDLYVVKNFTVGADGVTFKFVANGMYYGGAYTANTWNSFGGNDIALTEGTYDIYISKRNGAWCAVNAGDSVPDMKRYMYLKPDVWDTASPKYVAWCTEGSVANADKNFTWAMYEGGKNYEVLEIGDYTQFYIKRMSSDGKTKWNEVGPVTIGDNSLVTISGWSSFTLGTIVP